MIVLNAVGQIYRSFSIVSYLPIEELKSTLVELVHEPTGARVVHIANEDSENLFCISFQTLPNSSNGVAHILEHMVLCGSKKFPVRDPFFSMTRRSLNTYMNALTGQDFTCYPASSQIEKDFYNLLDVYLDAVFHPFLKKESFWQEGHRLTLVEGDVTKPLQYKGVVYNEMKGSMASLSRRLSATLFRYLTPALTYAYNSGGDPKEIPELTLEELKEFHRTYYHPSRAIFFFYGNLPLSRHLDRIEESVLRRQEKRPLLPPLPLQPRFQDPMKVVENYPIAVGESTQKKTEIAFGWLTAPVSQGLDVLALTLLDLLWMGTDGSPLKQALLKSDLCLQADSFMDAEMSEVPWVLVCKGCDESSADAIQALLFEEWKRLQKIGFTQEEIEASLHQLEFERMEINAEGGPFGLTLFFRSVLAKQHGCDLERGLFIHHLFDQLRAHLQEPSFFPDLIERFFINNRHFVQLTMSPDPTLDAKEHQDEAKRLEEVKKRLSPHDLQQIVVREESLLKEQEAARHQVLDCLPKLNLEDVPPHSRTLELRMPAPRTFLHSCFTNQVIYADLMFDLPEIEREDLPLLSLFARLLPEVGAGGRDYVENLAYLQAWIGDLEARVSAYVHYDSPQRIEPVFVLRGRALYRNCDKLFSLFLDCVHQLDVSEEERIGEWMQQHLTELDSQLSRQALRYAIREVVSGFSPSGYLANQWGGVPYYQAVQKWARPENRTALMEKLMQFRRIFLGSAQLVLGCEEECGSHIVNELLPTWRERLPKTSLPAWRPQILPDALPNAAYQISSPVAATALGVKTISSSHAEAPYLVLAAELMENVVLHKEIREKGGAYGGGANYSPSSGTYHFYAYRDPSLAQTLQTFERAVQEVGQGRFSERELEEAKFSALQSSDAPIPPGARAASAYSWQRSGATYEKRDRFRKAFLTATSRDVSDAVSRHLLLQEAVWITYAGEELLSREMPKLAAPAIPIRSLGLLKHC